MERFRATLAVFVSLSLAGGAGIAEPAQPDSAPNGKATTRSAYQPGEIHGDRRILHALNRFTFGPRPGDLEAVRAIGLDRWFDDQLHPRRLDETDLEARLAQFPAMRLSAPDILYRMPSNALLRQAADGKVPVPEAADLHAVYENEIARIQYRKRENERKKQEQALADAALATPGVTAGSTAATDASMNGSGVLSEPMAAPTMEAQAERKQPIANPPQSAPSQPAAMSMAPAATLEQPAFDEARIPPILALDPDQRVARLIAMTQPEFDGFRKALKGPRRAALAAGLTPEQRETVAALDNPQRQVADELIAQRLTREIYSNAQLQEAMTDFWLNHFNVYLHKNDETPYYLVSYERDAIRPLALGKFEDLLEAAAHSPAMLLYLDNSSSMGPDSPAAEKSKANAARHPDAKRKAPDGLNENYARELMELHTLGVNGGYTQADVTQVARILTGWTVDRPQRGGAFKFDENRHEPGTKTVLGVKFQEDGEEEGRELLHLLATRPATARFLSRKLAIRFVGDDPPATLVNRMADSYLASGGDISTVLKTLFHSPEFWAEDAWRAKVKTPLEYVVSAVRAGDISVDNPQPLANALREMGMPLYGSVPPTGYNWQAAAWVGTGALVNRMNFALSLASGKLTGISVAWASPQSGNSAPYGLPGFPAYTSQADEQRLESLLVPGGVSESTRTAVLDQFQAQIMPPESPIPAAGKPLTQAQATAALEKQDQLLAGLLLGSPEFQRR
jgi:uncharacterized protein (DUF1800 family)